MMREELSEREDFERQVVRFQAGAMTSEEIVAFEALLRTDKQRQLIYLEIEERSAEVARLLKREVIKRNANDGGN